MTRLARPIRSRRSARTAALAVACALTAIGCSGGSSVDAHRSTPQSTAPRTTVERPASAGCGRPADAARVGAKLPGDVPFSLPVGGLERTYRLGVPRSYDPNRPTPLIVDLHGAGSNAVQASVYSDLPRRAGARGDLVVTPDAIGGKWQISPAGTDADFLGALVDDVERRYCVDLDRVHLIGMSLGAWKAAATACHSGDRYASIVLVTVEVYPGTCPPLPVVVFHGTADPVVAYGPGGGTVDRDRTPNAGLPGTQSNVVRWAEGNGCAPKPAVREIGTDVILRRYRSCDLGADVDFYTIVGGGHTWPGSAITLGKPGLTTSTIDATRLALDWFAAHPRRR